MFGKKVFAAMLATVLGASLFGTNAAKAVIDLDTDMGGLVFAKETLLTARTIDGVGDNKDKTYFEVNGATDALDVTTVSKIGWTQNSSVRVTYELTGMVFSSQISAEDLTGAPGIGAVTKLGGGDPGESTVTFGVGTTAVSSGIIVTLDLGSGDDAIGLWVGGSGMGSGSVKVSIENVTFDVEHTAHRKDAIKTESGFKETDNPMTVTAEVKEGFRKFSGMGSSTDNLTATIGTFMVAVDGDTVKQSDGMVVTSLDEVVDSTSDKDITFGGDFSFVKMASLRETNCATTDGEVALMLDKDDDDNVTGVAGITVLQLIGTPTNPAVKYLCITVGGEEDALPITNTTYTITTMYDGITGAAFGPSGGTYELGSIKRNGTTVYIPFLSSFDGYNNRLVLVNRGAPTPYVITFTTEADVMAMPGMGAKGTLASGTTVMSLRPDADGNNDLVMITGGTRTAATFTAEASPGTIDVATTLVNTSNGSTDTVVYPED